MKSAREDNRSAALASQAEPNEPIAILRVGERGMREWMLLKDLPLGEYRLCLAAEQKGETSDA